MSDNRYFIALLAAALLTCSITLAGLIPDRLTCEYLVSPLGLEARVPRLSWNWRADNRLDASEVPIRRLQGNRFLPRGQRQTGYRILVASSEALLRDDKGDLWDSGKVDSSQSIQVRYEGRPLQSRQQCFWKVQTADKDGVWGPWSPNTAFEMGLLDEGDWAPATWIGLATDTRQTPLSKREVKTESMTAARECESFPSPLFRKDFDVGHKIVRARAYICGLGYYEFYLNGKKIGFQVLDPGQTTYDVRALYATHDITDDLNQGRNAVGLWLGNGFYGQNIAFAASGLAWGAPVVICKIVMDYNDGTSETVVTDESWKAETSPVVFDNVYAGETYDARCERGAWSLPGYDDYKWQKAVKVAAPCARLQAQVVPPIRKIRAIRPQQVIASSGGKWIVDLGQNITGWVRIRVNESPGTMITLRFAEMLTPDGRDIDVSTLGTGATGLEQKCIYVCKGNGWETWEPRFTYHGFRYVETSGLNHEPTLDMMEGQLVRSSVERRGSFTCSDEMLNRIYQASIWTIEDNLHSVPEDCPHREKCAWLGDAHSVAETTIINFDMSQFWTKFMDDIETVLGRGGETYEKTSATPGMPCNIAVGRRLCQEARPDWGAAIVLIPWTLYQYYGDTNVLSTHYEHMKRFVDVVGGMARDHIVYQGYGDWCPPGGNSSMECPVELTSTAYHYRTLIIMERFAGLAGRASDAGHFWEEAQATKSAFNAKFLNRPVMSYGSQTANAVAQRFGLVPEGREKDIARALAREVTDRHQGHAVTGIHGSRALYTLLCDYGFDDVAYDALTATHFPGHAFALSLGLTTWPETFLDSTDGKPVSQGSLNHLMQSGFAAWFHESLAGIRPVDDVVGFRRIVLNPHGINRVASVNASTLSMYGVIQSTWNRSNGKFEWFFLVPPNTSALAYVPANDPAEVEESGRPATESPGIKFLRYEQGRAIYEVESGSYLFKTTL